MIRARCAACVALVASLAACAAPAARLDGVIGDARALLAEGRSVEAIDALRRGIGRDPHERDGRMLLASAYRSLGTIEARAQAEEILEQLRLFHPDDVLVLRALADLHVEQGFLGRGRREYERVLRLTPDDAAAHLALGRLFEGDWLRTFRDEDYEKARTHYERSLECEPAGVEARVRLAFGEMEHGRPERAVAEALRLLAEHPEEARGHLLLGAIYARAADYAAAAAEFSEVRAAPEYLAAAEGIEFLLDEGAWFRYQDAEPWAREVARRNGWMEADPTPASGINERHVEHAARVFWCDLLYGQSRLGVRGWDTAAGEMYIRYGPPVEKTFIPGSVEGAGFIPPRWMFTYEVDGRRHDVVFEDLALSGRFYFPMSLVPTVADRLRETRPSQLVLPRAADELPFASRAWQFRGEGGRTRVEYYVEAPEPPAAGGSHPRQWGDVTREIVVMDTLWRARDRRRENFAEGAEVRAGSTYTIVDRSVLVLPPGPYRIATEIEDLRSGARGGRRERLDVRDLGGRGLQASDLVLGRPLPAGTRAAFPMLPEIGGAHDADDPLEVYFEVYDLMADLAGVRRWQARYTILPAATRPSSLVERGRRSLFGAREAVPPHVTQAFDEESRAAVVTRRLSVDLRSLPPGEYRMDLVLSDRNAGAEVSRSAVFRIVERGS